MIRTIRNTVGLTAATALLASAAAAQGLYWETTTTGIGTQPRSAKIYAVPKMMKIVQADGHAVIVRSDEDKLITVDTAKQAYHEMNIAGLEGAGRPTQQQLDAAHAQMEERMKNLPPEQRAMMEKMMPNLGAGKAVPVTVSRTDETKTISGYACTKYVAKQGDKTVLVAWTTRDVKGFEGLRDDWLKFQKRMSALSPVGRDAVEAYANIEGFPMATEMGSIKTEVTKVEPRAIPASEFQVPAGYKLETSGH